MDVEKFVDRIGLDFYTGVPDSQLRALCDYLYQRYGVDGKHHIIAANEGNAAGIAAGYHLATGKIPVVYMQNSGQGNAMNPLVSLLNEGVFAIPCVLIIGWRGEPGVQDEPQHIYQGKITMQILEDLGVDSCVVSKETSEEELGFAMEKFCKSLALGHDVAFVICKGALTYGKKVEYRNGHVLTREEAIQDIVKVSKDDPVICTTGKASRELFEIRKANGQGHKRDFLTVGSMGHASSIALGIALHTNKRVWCIDGDGAVLMHMGAMAVIGSQKPKNMVHIVINNGAHESVGGMPTVAGAVDLCGIARSCGYRHVFSIATIGQLKKALYIVKKSEGLIFLEIKCTVGVRPDLGRPVVTPVENKEQFMEHMGLYRKK